MCGVPRASKIVNKMHKMPMSREERVQKLNTDTIKIPGHSKSRHL